ncbi:GNAT superfamily N-acetyltransferase [Crossiella equi]|uniref:GNAT superfamily N-acetyltransferase n=1 Tax=Crossiella equi TaxID=130796 RepID=A0ABS5AEJ1_9PSEU|nr:GNAT family N-acetyltransferase [Crossiella equi]MBP2475010.1 GNAT superfamily N-acetyltransferase [Crossiella equi]
MIRAATTADAPAIGELKVLAWRAAYAGFMRASVLDALDPVQEARDWGEYLAGLPEEERLWVAELDGEVAGFCRTGLCAEEDDLAEEVGEVFGLYLHPARIGTGLGRALFGHAVADLVTRGHTPICVYAYQPNTSAIRFYEQAGFQVDGVVLVKQDAIGVPEVRLSR